MQYCKRSLRYAAGKKGKEKSAKKQRRNEKIMKNWKENVKNLFCGETIISKRELWLTGVICFLAGVVYGLFTAPWTRGVSIGCNCGNYSNYDSAEDGRDCDGKDGLID